MSTGSSHSHRQDRSRRQHLVDYLSGAALVALLVGPLALPPVLAVEGATSTVSAVLFVLGATCVGYLTGLLVLAQLVDLSV